MDTDGRTAGIVAVAGGTVQTSGNGTDAVLEVGDSGTLSLRDEPLPLEAAACAVGANCGHSSCCTADVLDAEPETNMCCTSAPTTYTEAAPPATATGAEVGGGGATAARDCSGPGGVDGRLDKPESVTVLLAPEPDAVPDADAELRIAGAGAGAVSACETALWELLEAAAADADAPAPVTSARAYDVRLLNGADAEASANESAAAAAACV